RIDVPVLRRRQGGSAFTPIAELQTNASGYWSRALTVDRSASYRFAWDEPATEPFGQPERHLSGIVNLARDTSLRWHASQP
ncbi:MAG: hypothetical protein ACXW08_13355, partial [Solirubrobacteraceae bacterium]